MPEHDKPMTYAGTGVDEDAMDPFKRAAQREARGTGMFLKRFGAAEVVSSRGESAYLMKMKRRHLAHVEEGLGTKNLVADAMYTLTGRTYYDHVAQCTVAMIVNDLITLGALPMCVAMHLAVWSSDWFDDRQRSQDLIRGWAEGCRKAGCSWSGGETPTLKGIIMPGTAVLAGSAIGLINDPANRITGNVADGDQIILIQSSGIHANGLTLARRIAEDLEQGYLTRLSDERTYGEALLDPTMIYVRLIEACRLAKIRIRYAVNVTGHGWRKLMRLVEPFTYIIEHVPEPHPVFRFMMERGPISLEEAYGNLNMGVGFALYVGADDVKKTLVVARKAGYLAFHVGRIERTAEKRVIIKPLGITFEGASLAVR